jgi:hypothetical protein
MQGAKMSFQEKNILVSLTNFSLILVYFLMRIVQLNLNGNFLPERVFQLWLTVIVFSIVVTIAGTILTHIVSAILEAIRTGDENPQVEDIEDERDKLIELRGTRVTYIAFSLAVFGSMLSYVFGQPSLVMFTGLILAGLIAQVIGDAYRMVLYRRGI